MARPLNGANLTMQQLQRLLNSRKRDLGRLQRKRATLEKRLAAIDDGIRSLGGAVSGGRGGARPRNDRPLVEVIHGVLQKSDRPLRVAAIADAARSAGYRSNSANFRGIVNQMLIKDKRFTTSSRGFYQVKK